MCSHKDDGLEEADIALDQQVRAHFREARQGARVPGFDALMANAEVEANGAGVARAIERLRNLFSRPAAAWAGGAVVAGALGVFVLLVVRPASDISEETMLARLPASVSVSEQQLVADLNSSTRWRAPSDRWPAVEADLDILGLPDLDSSAGRKEESAWL